jgi:hypothetical protein
MAQTGGVAGDRLSDWISVCVLASWVPRDAVGEAVEAAGKAAKRKGGKLPPHVMVYEGPGAVGGGGLRGSLGAADAGPGGVGLLGRLAGRGDHGAGSPRRGSGSARLR